MTSAADKTELRVRLRALRRSLARENPQAAALAAAHLPRAIVASTKVAAGYHPQGSELDPAPVAARFAAASALWALPAGEARDRPLVFRMAEPGASLVPDAFGIPAPGPSAASVIPDLLVVPLLAFDRAGRRLGQGAGAYDRTIANLRAGGRVLVLGLAYAAQEMDQLPDEPHDQRLDGLLTETGYIEFC